MPEDREDETPRIVDVAMHIAFDGERVSGDLGGHRFCGWLGLLAALDGMREEPAKLTRPGDTTAP